MPSDFTWKPVELSALTDDSEFENLVNLEVCEDYTSAGNLFEPKTNKRKIVESTSCQRKKKAKKTHRKTTKPHVTSVITPSKQGSTIQSQWNTELKEDEINSEGSAWQTFGLPAPIIKSLVNLKFQYPTEIQALTLPPAIFGKKDILGAAETGSGKTLAFGLPILSAIYQDKLKNKFKCNNSSVKHVTKNLDKIEVTISSTENGIKDSIDKLLYALILTPTRELALQVQKHLSAVSDLTDIRIACIVGGMSAEKQERILKQRPEIVIATPGRLWEFIELKNEHLSYLSNLKFLVIDEADRMVEKGHFQELHKLLEKLNFDGEKRKNRQNFIFSATLTLVHELPKYLATKKKLTHSKNITGMTSAKKLQDIMNILGVTDPKIIDISEGKGTSNTLTECKILCSFEEKDYYLYYFLQKHPGRTIVFCNSIGCVKRVTTILKLLDCEPLPLHAAMPQRQRLKNLDRFTEKEDSILIATDVAARGLDIPNVEHVIHYQTPRTNESYVHRSGRTARVSKEGVTVVMIEPSELQNYMKLCRALGKENDLPNFPINENILNCIKERVNLARDLDTPELHFKRASAEISWFEKAAESMDIILDDNLYNKEEKKNLAPLKKAIEFKRKQLKMLLAKPLFPKGFSGKYPMNVNNIPITDEFHSQEKAVSVMKKCIQDSTKNNTRRPWFKQKRKLNK